MWEVVWTDPDRESRKDRRERKNCEQGQRDKYPASRSSISTQSSSSSGSKPYKSHYSLPRTRDNPVVPLSPAASSASIDSRTSNDLDADGRSTLTTGSKATSLYSTTSKKQPALRIKDPVGIFQEPYSPLQSPKLSPTAFWNTALAGSVAVESCHLIQTLGPGSIIIRSTEIVVSSRVAEADAANMGSKATITANILEDLPFRPGSSESLSQSTLSNRAPGSLPPRGRPSLTALRRVSSWTTAPKTPTSEGWKPPNAWDCPPQMDIPTVVVDGVVTDVANVCDDGIAQLDDTHDNSRRIATGSDGW